MKRVVAVLLLLAGLVALPGGIRSIKSAAAKAEPPRLEQAVQLTGQPVLPAWGGEALAEGAGESGSIDLTGLEAGYIMARCLSQRQARLVISRGEMSQTHWLPADGSPNAFALTLGAGSYRATLYLQLEGDYYQPLARADFELALADPLAPYRLATARIPFTQGSQVYGLARQLAAGCTSANEYARVAFDWVTWNIDYDEALADERRGVATTPSNPDEILARGTGTCVDYATLYAALMRAMGIPCQMVFGMVDTPEEGRFYHAWNLVWLPGAHNTEGWQLYDPTFGHAIGHGGVAEPGELGYAYDAPDARF